MSDVPLAPRCPRCGREAGAIFGCSERASARCSFAWQGESRDFLAWAGIATAALLVAVVARALPWLSLILVAAAIGLLAWGFSREVQLYDARRGIRLRRTTVAHFELSYQWTLTEQQLPIHLQPGRPLTYPLSIVALAACAQNTRRDVHIQAAEVLRAAFLDLLARQRLAVFRVESYVFHKWRRSPAVAARYVLAATSTDPLPGAGALESDLLRLVSLWPRTSRAQELGARGPAIADVVLDLAGRNRSGYLHWLIERVASDAAVQGLGQFKSSLWWRNLEWDVTRAEQMAAEGERLSALSARLAAALPDFSRELDRQILSAITVHAPSD